MIETDVVVVGAGPVGLFQVFQLGLLEVRSQVVDSLPAPGGQCAELYGDKPIYDIPGIPVCTGAELAARLFAQAAPFAAGYHFGDEVASVEPEGDGFHVGTAGGKALRCKAVIVAAGVGAFQPRTLRLPGIEAFRGRQLLHGELPDATRFDGQHVVVVGGDAGAVAAARRAAESAAGVTLLHRREVPGSAGVRVVEGQATGFDVDAAGRLQALRVACSDGADAVLRADVVWLRLGLSPRLGPIAGWGLALERKQIVVDTERFETSTPGIFAVGDVVAYPGKKKLVVCGFHEATLAAWAAAGRVFPGRAMPLQYTTTSPRLQRLLGVAGTP